MIFFESNKHIGLIKYDTFLINSVIYGTPNLPNRMVDKMAVTRLIPSSGLIQEITSMPGGELIEKCAACGVCTADCTVAPGSQYNPRQIIQKILIGARQRVFENEQLWLCNTCPQCENACQYGVKLDDVFKIVRKLAIKEGFGPIN
jgi:heterodisulfide reductase subunit C